MPRPESYAAAERIARERLQRFFEEKLGRMVSYLESWNRPLWVQQLNNRKDVKWRTTK